MQVLGKKSNDAVCCNQKQKAVWQILVCDYVIYYSVFQGQALCQLFIQGHYSFRNVSIYLLFKMWFSDEDKFHHYFQYASLS